MKVLLLQPPVEDFYDTDIRLQPIGLCYLKAALKKYCPEVEVKVIDFHQGRGRATTAIPKELKYLKAYYPHRDRSPFSTFHHYYRFGASYETIAAEVALERPDVVGISCLFSPYYREALKAAEVIKAATGATIIMGGSHVSAAPLSVLEHPAVDFIIRGEGEKPLVEFVKAFSAPAENAPAWVELPNLGFKKAGICQLNPLAENYAMEDLPPPDLADLSPETYTFNGKPLTFMITSRSCPHHCSFCSVHMTFGQNYRRNKVENVLAEMQLRYDEGYRVFDFEDDNLTFYRKEMLELCEAIPKLFPQGDIELVAMNGVSYLSLDANLLKAMKKAGFSHLNLALVSSDRAVLETTKRPHTVGKFLEVVREAFSQGFATTAYQILGLPFESLDSMIQTLLFLAAQPVLIGASMFYMTPNSPIARDLSIESSPEDMFKARLTAMAIETANFCREDIYTLFITTRILNFLKSSGFQSLERERDQLGKILLQRLFQEQKLFAKTSQGLAQIPKFNSALFFRIWQQLEAVCTLNGDMLYRRDLVECLSHAFTMVTAEFTPPLRGGARGG